METRKPSGKMTKPIKTSFLSKGVKPRIVRLTESQKGGQKQ